MMVSDERCGNHDCKRISIIKRILIGSASEVAHTKESENTKRVSLSCANERVSRYKCHPHMAFQLIRDANKAVYARINQHCPSRTIAKNCPAECSQENRRAVAVPAFAKVSRNTLSFSKTRSRSSRAFSSRGGKVKQFSPARTYSSTPPDSLTMQAQPQAMASSGGSPKPSHHEVEMNIPALR